MRISHDGVTVRGRRENNEDALLSLPERGLFAVADGMGGYEGGEVASEAALASLHAYCDLLGEEGMGLAASDASGGRSAQGLDLARERLALAVRIADRQVRRRAVGRLSKMGTTLACLVVGGGHALMAHVGDSRVYRLRDGRVEALTRDHSLLNEMEASGIERSAQRSSRLSNVITQALGQGPDARPDLRAETLLPGDRFLLCSDGLSDVLDDETIAWLLSAKRGVAQALVDAAYEAGSTDNITALVVTASES